MVPNNAIIPIKNPHDTSLELYQHLIHRSDDNNTNLQQITNYDFETNIYPNLRTKIVKQISFEEYNIIKAENIKICSQFINGAHSLKYQRFKNKIYEELILWIKSLPTIIHAEMNLNIIQPDAIVMFLTNYYIKKHGKKTQAGFNTSAESSSSATSILENYYISASLLKTVIGAISSILSSMYGRTSVWSQDNPTGNPCRATLIILFKKTYGKVLSKNEIVSVPSTPITKSMLIEIINALDEYIDNNLQNVATKLEINKLLLLQRDIAFYIYLFISSQRGGEGCLILTANVTFHRDTINDTIDHVNITIPASDVKNHKKINIEIRKFDIFEAGNKFCFIYRQQLFKDLCIKFGHKEEDMLVVFPCCKRNKTLDFSKTMNYQSSLKKFKENLKIVGLDKKYNFLTLHSFRRGSIQNYQASGESREATKKRASFTNAMYDRYTDNTVKTKKDFVGNNKGKEIADDDDDENIEDIDDDIDDDLDDDFDELDM